MAAFEHVVPLPDEKQYPNVPSVMYPDISPELNEALRKYMLLK